MNVVREELIAQKRIGMAKNHYESVKSILKFVDKDNIPMRMITPTFCKQYEDYMLRKSRTKTRNGAGINLQQIRIFPTTICLPLIELVDREMLCSRESSPYLFHLTNATQRILLPESKRLLCIDSKAVCLEREYELTLGYDSTIECIGRYG